MWIKDKRIWEREREKAHKKNTLVIIFDTQSKNTHHLGDIIGEFVWIKQMHIEWSEFSYFMVDSMIFKKKTLSVHTESMLSAISNQRPNTVYWDYKVREKCQCDSFHSVIIFRSTCSVFHEFNVSIIIIKIGWLWVSAVYIFSISIRLCVGITWQKHLSHSVKRFNGPLPKPMNLLSGIELQTIPNRYNFD